MRGLVDRSTAATAKIVRNGRIGSRSRGETQIQKLTSAIAKKAVAKAKKKRHGTALRRWRQATLKTRISAGTNSKCRNRSRPYGSRRSTNVLNPNTQRTR